MPWSGKPCAFGVHLHSIKRNISGMCSHIPSDKHRTPFRWVIFFCYRNRKLNQGWKGNENLINLNRTKYLDIYTIIHTFSPIDNTNFYRFYDQFSHWCVYFDLCDFILFHFLFHSLHAPISLHRIWWVKDVKKEQHYIQKWHKIGTKTDCSAIDNCSSAFIFRFHTEFRLYRNSN